MPTTQDWKLRAEAWLGNARSWIGGKEGTGVALSKMQNCLKQAELTHADIGTSQDEIDRLLHRRS